MYHKFQNILRSELVRNSTKLLSANVLAQVVGLLVYPLLTRLYSPADFGLLNLFLNIGAILVLLATAEYQYAIVLCKEDNSARSAFQLASGLLVLFTFLLILLMPFSRQLASFLNAEDASSAFCWLPLFVWTGGLWNILNLYLTRCKRFGAVSRYKMSMSLLQAGGKLAFGYGGMLRGGLVWSSVLAPVCSLAATFLLHLRRDLRALMHIDFPLIREVARTYRRFPLYSLPRALVNSLGLAVPAFILTRWFDLDDFGRFSMAITLAFGPVSMIVGSVQQVLFQQIAEAVNKRQPIRRRLTGLMRNTLLLVLPCFAVLFVVLPTLTEWLLGEGWALTGTYIRFMLPWLLLTCLNGPICSVPDVFMEQKIGFLFECAILLLRTVGLTIGVLTCSFNDAVIGYCAMTALALAIQLVWYYRLISRYEKGIVYSVDSPNAS